MAENGIGPAEGAWPVVEVNSRNPEQEVKLTLA